MIKVLRRGTGPNVDMPKKIIPGAGEHVEPKDVKNGKFEIKENAIRAVREEIGMSDEDLVNSYLIPLGSYSTLGRDPRYWKFCTVTNNGEIKEFGIERESLTTAYVLYLTSEHEPEEIDHHDTEEIIGKFWLPLNSVLKIKTEEWMIFDHRRLIIDAIKMLSKFDKLSDYMKETVSERIVI